MRMRMRVLCLAAAVLLTICSLCPALALIDDKYPENYEDAKNSVVRLYCEYECKIEIIDKESQQLWNGQNWTTSGNWTGSGIAVGNAGEPVSYFLTNRHVVSLCYEGATFEIGNSNDTYMEFYLTSVLAEPNMYEVVCTGVGNQSNQQYLEKAFYARITVKKLDMYVIFTSLKYKKHAQVIMHSDKSDLGLVKLDQPTTERIPITLRPFEYGKLGNEKVYALGFPAVSDDNDRYTEDQLNSTLLDMTVTDGIINFVKTHAATGEGERIQHTAKIFGGNSGGALVDEHGYLLGVNNAHMVKDSAYSLAVSVNEAIDVLDGYGVPYILMEDAVNASATPTPTIPPTSTPSPTPTSTPTIAPTPEPVPEPDPFPLVPVIGGAVVVLGGGGAAIAVISSKKKKKNNGSRPAGASFESTNAGAYNSRPVSGGYGATHTIRGQVGAVAGQAFSLNGTLYIGCDPARCQIVFPAGTPGVSRLHCSISLENGTVIVRDNGSTYGTYVDNQKLQPGQAVAVRPGQKIYLGSMKQALTLDN